MKQWWKNTVFYEIYIPSFCDSNGDGVGDIPGIILKLPYLKELGAGGIWLTPFYPSPKVDNGYDVSDYYGVDPVYGTITDFENLIKAAHHLGIKVIADMVINHTSTRHPWFLASSSAKDDPKRDWYLWRNPVAGKPPNNWESFFGGSAWEYDEKSGQYYYHSFAKEQADLNWQNPQVKQAIRDVLDYWLQKGVDGFRFDVINNLSIANTLSDNPIDEKGVQLHSNDVNQPGIHQVIAEICQPIRVKQPDVFLVGEISSDELERIHSYTVSTGLDTTFNFNLGSRENFQFGEIMQEIKKMHILYGLLGYPTVFFGSHDMRRFADRFSFSTGQVKCLLTFMIFYKGIPFLYFGDELGMNNRILKSVEEAKDIQGILAYEAALKEGKEQTEAIRILNEKSRDASRNFMDWETAIKQSVEPFSCWNYLRALIAIRRLKKEMTLGEIKLFEPAFEVMAIERSSQDKKVSAIINFSSQEFLLPVADDVKVILASEADLILTKERELRLSAGSSVILEGLVRLGDGSMEA